MLAVKMLVRRQIYVMEIQFVLLILYNFDKLLVFAVFRCSSNTKSYIILLN